MAKEERRAERGHCCVGIELFRIGGVERSSLWFGEKEQLSTSCASCSWRLFARSGALAISESICLTQSRTPVAVVLARFWALVVGPRL